MNDDPNLEILTRLVGVLGNLADNFVFVGGCAVGLLITDPAAPPIRETYDVDVVADVASLVDYYQITKSLKKLGFTEDPEVYCRWNHQDLSLDVMSADPDILGFGNPWYETLVRNYQSHTLPDGRQIKLVSAPYFLITKILAFEGRGNNDYLASHDLEDLLAIIDGRPEVVDEVHASDEELKTALSSRFKSLLEEPRFRDALPGHISDTSDSPSRLSILEQRLQELATIK